MEPSTVMQFNVFEDGLHDTPSQASLSREFYDSFKTLLECLSNDGQGNQFYVFEETRDFSHLPNCISMNSPDAFFGMIQILYSILYHPIRGNSRIGENSTEVGNSLSTLFLHAALTNTSKQSSSTNYYVAEKFETELYKAASKSKDNPEIFKRIIEQLKAKVYCPKYGELNWDTKDVEQIWKRRANVLRHRWLPNLEIFISASQSDILSYKKEIQSSLSKFIRVVYTKNGTKSGTKTRKTKIEHVTPNPTTSKDPKRLSSLIEVEINSNTGDVEHIRSMTLHSTIWYLIESLCMFFF